MDPKAEAVSSIMPWIDGLTVFGVVGGTAKAFEWFDGLLNDAGRDAVGTWLRNARPDSQIDSWITVFPRLIDIIFGPRALSLKFIFRSCIASVVAVAGVAAIYSRVVPSIFNGAEDYGAVIAGSFVANLAPDYLSLLASRFIVAKMAQKPHLGRIAALLIADTLITSVIALFGSILAILAVSFYAVHVFGVADDMGVFSQARKNLLDFLDEYRDFRWLLHGGSDLGPLGIFFYSSFFTSLWVWLYVLSGLTIKLLHKIQFAWSGLLPYLDIEKKPLTAIGRVAGLLAGAAYSALLGALWIHGRLHR